MNAQQQAGSRRILEALCEAHAPAHLGDFQEALTQLQRRGVDLEPIERALTRALARGAKHRERGTKTKGGLAFAKRRAATRRRLLRAVVDALALYRSEYPSDVPASPIYALCLGLHERLGQRYRDAVADVVLEDPVPRRARITFHPLLPDLLYDDAVWGEKRLRQPRRGPRTREYVPDSRAELRAARVPVDLIPVLLRGVR